MKRCHGKECMVLLLVFRILKDLGKVLVSCGIMCSTVLSLTLDVFALEPYGLSSGFQGLKVVW